MEGLKIKGITYAPKEHNGFVVGGDYAYKDLPSLICIDRKESALNSGFIKGRFSKSIFCDYRNDWREATEGEVKEALIEECVQVFGEDFKNVRLKHNLGAEFVIYAFNIGDNKFKIVKGKRGWEVWNKNGLLYYNGAWNEPLEEGEIALYIKEYLKQRESNPLTNKEKEEQKRLSESSMYPLTPKDCFPSSFRRGKIAMSFNKKENFKEGEWVYSLTSNGLKNSKYTREKGYVFRVKRVKEYSLNYIGIASARLENFRKATKLEVLNAPNYDGSATDDDFPFEKGNYISCRMDGEIITRVYEEPISSAGSFWYYATKEEMDKYFEDWELRLLEKMKESPLLFEDLALAFVKWGLKNKK